jgi:prophage regulatory protein
MSKLMRLPEVVRLTGIPRSSVYSMVSKNLFPRPIKLSERSSAWRLDELQVWIEARTKASRPQAGAP